MNKPLVSNAADESQVKEAETRVKHRRERDHDDLKYLLQSQQGRRFVWRLLDHCQTNASPMNTNALLQSHFIGKQDVGRFILSEVVLADKNAYLKMMTESNEGKL